MAFMRDRDGRDRDSRDKDKEKKKRKPRGLKARKRVCRVFSGTDRARFYQGKKFVIDYKDIETLSQFLTERYKIVPRRITGASAREQREITQAVKRARIMALIPFTATQLQLK